MYNPSVSLAIKIARVFGVPVEEAFILDGGEKRSSSRDSGKKKGAK
jgi:DNA-binding XRE family transcriptional regulator